MVPKSQTSRNFYENGISFESHDIWLHESEMKPDVQTLLKKSSEEKFCKHVAVRREMRHEFDKKLGKVNYVHVERENVTQFVVYSKRHSFFITTEPEITSSIKLGMIMKIKKIISTLK